jgi:hypothetical protein
MVSDNFIVSGIFKRRKEKEHKIFQVKLREIHLLLSEFINPLLSLSIKNQVEITIKIYNILIDSFNIFISQMETIALTRFLNLVYKKGIEIHSDLLNYQLHLDYKIKTVTKKFEKVFQSLEKRIIVYFCENQWITGTTSIPEILLENPCAICLDLINPDAKQENITTVCHHTFHKKCILHNLLSEKNTCPLCRTTIVFSSNIV